ncbi:uncharacterized protein L201_000705 [Kwoniella dendrophila CBS 6074]|uniref:WD repeat protein mio zinc-ribbon like domain-containing protein n=1 Tax=Kwoniella dendrophila CBS 6074 TaxID=1295534 RepID=A0AAX4JLX3_9TREE
MAASEIKRIALSDPHSTFPPRFVVGGQVSQNVSGDVKMYEWNREKGEMGMVGLQTDVGQIRSMAWSPLPTHRNIIATGLSTGKTIIQSLSSSTLSFPLSLSNSNSVTTQTQTTNIIATLNVKYSRPVTSISFSKLDSNYLATGYEKHRSEYSLLIWDISDAIQNSQLPSDFNSNENWERPLENKLEVTNLTAKINVTSEPRHIQHYCPSENVNSISFLPNSINQLLASVSNKTIRLYDLRSPSPPSGSKNQTQDQSQIPANSPNANVNTTINQGSNSIIGSSIQWMTRSVYGLTPNEDKDGLFASFEIIPSGSNTHSIVKLWDIRKPGQEILNLDVPGSIVNLEWKTGGNSEGLLGVGTREKGVGLWEIIEGKRVEDDKVVEEWVTLGGMRQIVKPRSNLHSFTFAPSQTGQGDVMFVLKDGTIGIGPIGTAPIFAGGPQGDVAICAPSLRVLNPDEIPEDSSPDNKEPSKSPIPATRPEQEELEVIHRANRFQLAPERVTQLIAERSRSSSPMPPHILGTATPASEKTPYGSISGLREWYEGTKKRDLVDDDEQLIGGWEGWRRTLGSDVGAVMRRRAMEGYGLDDFLLNAAIATRHPGKERLAGIWEFIDHLTRVMSPPLSSYRGYNLTHHGVYPIWFGISSDQTQPSSPTSIYSATTLTDGPNPQHYYNHHSHHPPLKHASASAAWTSLKSQSTTPIPPHSRQSSSPMPPGTNTPAHTQVQSHRERKASDRRGGNEIVVDRDYISAVEMLNERRREVGGIGRPGTVRAAVGGDKMEMRKLILSICGENSESAKEELDRLVESGQRTKAAFRAYFAGDEAATVNILMASEDQHHRLLGSTIAGFMTQSASARGSEFFNSHWQGLVNRVDDPFIRAILSKIGGDDWESVLEEEGIPLLDRIGVGVQYLDDRDFSAFLKGRLSRLTRSNSLHLLGLTGLSGGPGISLLSRFLARTGDIQTVSIISSLFHFNKLNKNELKKIKIWKETYRNMLDSWGMFSERCEFDIKSNELQRILIQIQNQNNGEGGFNLKDKDDLELYASSVGERCPVCNNLLSKETESRLHRKHAIKGHVNVGWPSERTTTCMYCSAALPRCVICLMHVDPQRPPPLTGSGIEDDHPEHITDTIDAAYVCCLTCRHGGHASHILPWFEGGLDGGLPHSKCPVYGCECECASL